MPKLTNRKIIIKLRVALLLDIKDLRAGNISCKRAIAMSRLCNATMHTMCK